MPSQDQGAELLIQCASLRSRRTGVQIPSGPLNHKEAQWGIQHLTERISKIRSCKEVIEECLRLKELGAKVSTVGKSRFGRKIVLITIGKGEKRALIVCRQHGNEPTSTEAMLDYSRDMLTEYGYSDLIKKVELSILPMANPDGAELYAHICRHGTASLLTSYAARSNRPYIGDINRDHKKRKTSEARAIWSTIKETEPHVLLDLHNFFPTYEYFIFRRPVHNFCPLCPTHPEIKSDVLRRCFRICVIARNAVKNVGGNPAEINSLWPGIHGRLTMSKKSTLETCCAITLQIPSIAFESLGGFNLCLKQLNEGKEMHSVAVNAVIKALANDEL